MLGFLPSSGFQRYTLNSRVSVAPEGIGHALPPVIFEFFGSANSAILLTFRHTGAMRSIAPRCAVAPRRISGFRVWSCGPSRNHGTVVCSVHPRLRWDVLNVVRHRVVVHRAIIDRGLATLVDPRQRMLHPVLVIALGKVLARMR